MSTQTLKPKVTNPQAVTPIPKTLKGPNNQPLKGESLLSAASAHIQTPQYILEACQSLADYDTGAAASHVILSIAANQFSVELSAGNYGQLPTNVTAESLAKYIIRTRLPGHSAASIDRIYKLNSTIELAKTHNVDLTQCNSPTLLYKLQERMDGIRNNKALLQPALEAVAANTCTVSTLDRWLKDHGLSRKQMSGHRKPDDRIRPSNETVSKWLDAQPDHGLSAVAFWLSTQPDDVALGVVANTLEMLGNRGYTFEEPNPTK